MERTFAAATQRCREINFLRLCLTSSAFRRLSVEKFIERLRVCFSTGHDAAQLLGSMCPNMRVLIVAGLPDDRLVHHRTKGEGFAAFPKPFNPKQLTEKVKDVLNGNLE